MLWRLNDTRHFAIETIIPLVAMEINEEDQTLDGRGGFVPVCSLKFFSQEEEPERWRKER